jgi:hypothetical protein
VHGAVRKGTALNNALDEQTEGITPLSTFERLNQFL